MKKSDRAWLAGILEGEGYFGWNVNPRGHRVPVIEVSMTDRDIVERLAAMFGTGLRGPYGPYRTQKMPFFKVQAYGRNAVRVARLVRPWMGARRGAKIDLLLLWKFHRVTNNPKTGRLEVAECRSKRIA